jgi:SAM-dependent methyltransferase
LLNPCVKKWAFRFLPSPVLRWLDPVQHLIDSEVACAAASAGENDLILDAGAGESRHRFFFSRGQYIALDAASGDAAWDYSKLDLVGDLESIPLRTAAIDQVLCMVVLEHTRRPALVLSEIARVLRDGGRLWMVVPFLWEEHQSPHDYFRFTRFGLEQLMDGLPLDLELLEPMGGFFWLAARRCVNLLDFFQWGWRWLLFPLLAPLFGFLFPILLYFLDVLDESKRFSLGYRVRAVRRNRG